MTDTPAKLAADFKSALLNGIGSIGFTHLNEPGLAAKYHLQVPSSVGNPQNDINANDPSKALEFYIQTLHANVQAFEDYCAEKKVSDRVKRAFRPLALAIRGVTALFGASSAEHVPSIAGEKTNIGAEAKEAAQVPISYASMWLVVRAINFVNTNHCTSGPTLPQGQLNILTQRVLFQMDDGGQDAKMITDVMYWAMHPACPSWGIRRSMQYPCDDKSVAFTRGSSTQPADVDDWLAIRCAPMPAGTHAVSTYAALVSFFNAQGLSVLLPEKGLVASAAVDIAHIKADPMAYHPGRGYFGRPQPGHAVDASQYKDQISVLANGLHRIAPGHSILRSPAVQKLMTDGGSKQFSALCERFAGGIDETQFDELADALGKAGSSAGVIPDFQDAARFRAAVANADTNAANLARAMRARTPPAPPAPPAPAQAP